jgi:hypothetical protein
VSESNPYTTPNARLADPPEPVDQRFRWKAVLIGAAADLGGSTIAGIVLVIVFSVTAGPGQGSAEDVLGRLALSWPFLMTSMIVGGAFTVLGGYVAGRLARHSFLRHALAAGVLSLVLGIVFFGGDDGPYAGLIAIVGYGLHLPLAVLGGWVAGRGSTR